PGEVTFFATSSGSAPTGMPIALQMGTMEAKKVTSPGRPTAARLIATASAAPAMYCAMVGCTPNSEAQYSATARFATGEVMRNTDTANGRIIADTRGGTSSVFAASSIAGNEASEERVLVA